MERSEVFRSILVQEGMENEVGLVLDEHDAGWSNPSSPTRVAKPRGASTRDEWRGNVNPHSRRGRSETTPRREVIRRGLKARGITHPRARSWRSEYDAGRTTRDP
ncbi:hypothetical protein F2Q70_00014496 [Brassica cretica]|uniref:Uncharacterized protein n=1 Tax=Brassica cretica TaxID=69181 RepID=A0A8S9I008_BRACR|nr:hypothetical protein F2Q70_00014496 [Brassica cretica]